VAAASGFGGVCVQADQTPTRSTTQSRPNILFMLSDNVGYGVLSSFNGGISETPTPRIDSLGAAVRHCWRGLCSSGRHRVRHGSEAT
jgi:hypothetical protein